MNKPSRIEIPASTDTKGLTDKRQERKELCEQLRNCIKNWEWSTYDFHYNYMQFYHPHKREYDYSHGHKRNFIWDFKDGNADARNEVVHLVKKMLKEHFGALTEKLTLVCITANNAERTHRRYKVFADTVCKDLGMSNAYDHIRIVSNGISKHNCPEGSTPRLPKLEFDKEYFEGRHIVLFDDVITSGWTIRKYKYELEMLGAETICAITIGKTI